MILSLPDDPRARLVALAVAIAEAQAARDAEAVVVIARSVQGRVFSAAELFAQAAIDPALQDALEGADTPKCVGHRLRALVGRDAYGLRLVRLEKRDKGGCIWAIHLHPAAGVSRAAGAY